MIRPPRTVTLTDNFPLHPPSFSLLFLLPLKDSSTYKPQLLSLRPPASSAPPPPPLFPSDRLSDSKSETLIQRSAQVSWILLKSHFHFTSSLLASLPPPTRKHQPPPSSLALSIMASSIHIAHLLKCQTLILSECWPLFSCQFLLSTHNFLSR